jgi:hypothetical protein
MEKYIDVTVHGVTKKDLKNLLLDTGLSKMFLKRRFFDGKVYVDFEEKSPYTITSSGVKKDHFKLDIFAISQEKAVDIYNLILEKKDEMAKDGRGFYLESSWHLPSLDYMENNKKDKIYSGTGNKTGGMIKG